FSDEVATGTRVRAWPWRQRGRFLGPYVGFLEGGGALVVGDGNGLIEVRDVATGRRIRHAVAEFGVVQMTVSPDRRRLVASHGDGRFTVFSLPELTRLYVSERIHDHPPSVLAFSADGRWLVTGAYGKAAVLWATDSWQPVLSLPEAVSSLGGNGWINPIAFLADGPRLVVAQRAKGVDGWSIWDLSQIGPKLDELGLGWEVSEASRTRPSRPVGRTAAVTERTLIPAPYDLKLCLL